MMVIGLTGGIGSGKSTVLELFKKQGAAVYSADLEAKKIMQVSTKVRSEISELLGDKSYINDTLNRQYIADVVFNDPKKLEGLNAIVHPEVQRHFKSFLEIQNSPYVVYESALLLGSSHQHFCDKIILVIASVDLRIKRLLRRGTLTLQQIQARMNNQLTDAEQIPKADYVIHNDDLKNVEREVLQLHQLFLESIKH